MSKSNRIQRLAVTTTLGLLGVSVCSPPASAAEPGTRTSCSDYTNSKVWQTRTQWARVSERVCVEWTNPQPNGSWLVRGQWQFRIDWPTDCSLSVGLPPSGGMSCPAGRALKEPSLTFKNVIMDGRWKEGSAPTRAGRCQLQNRYVSRMIQSTFVQGCSGPWMQGVRGRSYTVAISAQADVANDGDGQKFLGEWIRKSWIWH